MCPLGGREGELARGRAGKANLTVMAPSDGHWSPEDVCMCLVENWISCKSQIVIRGGIDVTVVWVASSAHVVSGSGDIVGSTSLPQSLFLGLSVHCH
ncbi:hypothetical protein WUBG_01326 [Wuchereria bancrofti]|uniref:Uncharacterized protein n=1 Tax=Wuchereria bancrofti TaxID=6293 RepID=J9EYS9_WUCBA|nr:hypothetical protein WUBG_01326 [Wuchereria bancrofti]